MYVEHCHEKMFYFLLGNQSESPNILNMPTHNIQTLYSSAIYDFNQ